MGPGTMLRSLDAALIRLATARLGAVSRVGAVARTEGSPLVDAARGTDARWPEIIRPDPAKISLFDITRFQSLVRGGGQGQFTSWAAGPEDSQRLGIEQPVDEPMGAEPPGPLPPAERIVSTLRCLGGVHGL